MVKLHIKLGKGKMRMNKKIKIALCFGVILLLSVCLNGCSGKNTKEPDGENIKNDLQKELTLFNEDLNFEEYSIEKSLTENKEYSAQIIVLAKNNYSEHQLITEVKYILYDQGWILESCQWQDDSYTVVSYPTTDEMLNIINETQELVAVGLNEQQNIEVQPDANTLTCKGVLEKEDNPYYICKGYVFTDWDYNPDKDSWEFSSAETTESKCELTSLLELNGTWESTMKERVGDPSTYITISNYDINSLDISSELYNSNTVHAELEECYLSEYGMCIAIYKGTGITYSMGDTMNKDLPFTVKVLVDEDGSVQLQFSIEDPENPALVTDIADIAEN